MKTWGLLVMMACLLVAGEAGASSYPRAPDDVYVNGYSRKDGSYVAPHYRSRPDGNPYNNYGND